MGLFDTSALRGWSRKGWSAGFFGGALLLLGFLLSASSLQAQRPMGGDPEAPLLFTENFDQGMGAWFFPLGHGHRILDGSDVHGPSLRLQTENLPVYALIRGSDRWENVRIEGKVLFPDDAHNYLGFIYRFVDDGRRMDFGSLYIKGNGSYVQANPHSDTNVGRTHTPEVRSVLDGPRAIQIGSWQTFALEVVGANAHLYVGEMTTPAMTLRGSHARRGHFGFKPRNPGAGVILDDLRVRAIEDFSYRGAPIPNPPYRPMDFITDWSVLGPLAAHVPAVERGPFDPDLTIEDDGRTLGWEPFRADHRGAVITGRITEYQMGRRVAYFHTTVSAEAAGGATLWLSSVDDVSIWVNGVFRGFASRQGYAWWDVTTNEEHRPIRSPIRLREGVNHIVVRVMGGIYATGGFYLAVRRDP